MASSWSHDSLSLNFSQMIFYVAMVKLKGLLETKDVHTGNWEEILKHLITRN